MRKRIFAFGGPCLFLPGFISSDTRIEYKEHSVLLIWDFALVQIEVHFGYLNDCFNKEVQSHLKRANSLIFKMDSTLSDLRLFSKIDSMVHDINSSVIVHHVFEGRCETEVNTTEKKIKTAHANDFELWSHVLQLLLPPAFARLCTAFSNHMKSKACFLVDKSTGLIFASSQFDFPAGVPRLVAVLVQTNCQKASLQNGLTLKFHELVPDRLVCGIVSDDFGVESVSPQEYECFSRALFKAIQ